jgi:hypothetical protein
MALIRVRRPTAVLIIADNDEPGRDGAHRLARSLRLHSRDVRVVCPPSEFKDLRAWVKCGATRSDMERLLAVAAPHALTVRVTFRGSSK